MMKPSLFLTSLGLVAAAPLFAQPAPPPAKPPMPPAMNRSAIEAEVKARFAEMDANKDGVVTREEATAAHMAMMKSMQDRMFDMMDTNKDGAVSRAEFDAHHAGMEGHHMEGGMMPPPPPPPGGPTPPRMDHPGAMRGNGDRMFDMADANKDSKVTEGEAVSAALSHFDAMDTNKDGTISPEERRAGWQKMRAEYKAAKGK